MSEWGKAGLAALALTLTACGGGAPAEENGATARAGASSPAASPALEARPDTSSLPEHDTEPIVRFTERGATVLANDARRARILGDLAREAGFRLEVSRGARLSGAVTLQAVDATLGEVLARLLAGLPYSLHYEGNGAAGAPVLRRVAVGEDQAESAARTAERVTEAVDRKRPVHRYDGEREPAVDLLANFFEEIESPGAEERANAAEFIHADAETIPALVDLLAGDPDPRVRAAAAETLGEADDTPEAVQALLRALDDPDPEVVIATIDALEWNGDERILLELGFLLEHPHSGVRERTHDALEWLEAD